MSVWNVLTGQSSDKPRPPSVSPGLPTTTAPSSSSRPAASPSDPESSQPFPSGSSLSTTSSTTPPSSPYYVPFPSSIDPVDLHPQANISADTLEYIRLDDSALSDLPGSRSALPSRGWTDDLCYGTGITYLSGLAVGGAWGLVEGFNKTPPSSSSRLRLNYVLNAVTRRGPFFGNSAGVLALTYNCTNSLIGSVRGQHDGANSVAAGLVSGMIFKSTRGPKPMVISGLLVGGLAGAWTAIRYTVFN